MGNPVFETLSEVTCMRDLQELIAVSHDVSSWTEENFLLDLPSKWRLSFAARLNDGLVGYCIMSTKFPGRVHIHQFMVTEASRGIGLGAAMLVEAKRRAHGQLLSLMVHTESSGAIRFYERNGFTIEKRDGDNLWMIAMKSARRAPSGPRGH